MKILGKVVAYAGLLLISAGAYAQRTYSPKLSIGAHAGATFSNMAFTPSVEQKMLTGAIAGVKIRYTEEKCVGVLGEINIAQRGWAEKYEADEPFQYSRTLTYVTIPIMTHIFFGPQRFKCFINLGPELAFMISDKVRANFDYANMSVVKNYPTMRETEQLYTNAKNKIDFGITAGIGGEWYINRRNSVTVEARYYFGLGNIYPSSKKDTFAASRGNSIEVTAGYMFRLK